VEVTVLNKDIGFMRPGQPVTVKIDSFPYTRYGYLTGSVASVSHDAAQDEKLGLVFPARIKLDSSTLEIEDVKVRMSAGMSLSAEIKTGKRRVRAANKSSLNTSVEPPLCGDGSPQRNQHSAVEAHPPLDPGRAAFAQGR
jgi:hemolysin D